jgi:hypothetical protein
MSQKQSKTIWVFVLLVLIATLRIGCKHYIYDSGTADGVTELQHIYQRAGTPLAVIYTNSIIQNFPFEGRINWNLSLFRDYSVSLSGMVDTNKLAEYISNHPTISFLRFGKSKDGIDVTGDTNGITAYGSTSIPNAKDITWHKVYFQFEQGVGEYSVIIIGDVDFDSGLGKLSAHESEYLNKQ